eukprot:scaffold122969_cov52-Phaeocystis_antarctica.AAC.5
MAPPSRRVPRRQTWYRGTAGHRPLFIPHSKLRSRPRRFPFPTKASRSPRPRRSFLRAASGCLPPRNASEC